MKVAARVGFILRSLGVFSLLCGCDPKGSVDPDRGGAQGAGLTLEAGAKLASDLPQIEPRELTKPPFDYLLNSPVDLVAPSGPPRLQQFSAKPNEGVSVDAWFKGNQLTLPVWSIPKKGARGTLPSGIPVKLGVGRLRRAIHFEDHAVLIYRGSSDGVAVLDDAKHVVSFMDFGRYRTAPGGSMTQDTVWGQVSDGVLFVSHANDTYANSSRGHNAYITAIDIKTGDLKWRSDPLVANARNFVISGGVIYTAYGFRTEKNRLYTLDASTGKMLTQVELDHPPEYVFKKASRVHVRTKGLDYVFVVK